MINDNGLFKLLVVLNTKECIVRNDVSFIDNLIYLILLTWSDYSHVDNDNYLLNKSR